MYCLIYYGKNKMGNNIWEREQTQQLNEKLQLLEKEHLQKMEHIKLSYQKECDEKIASLRGNVKDCVLEILSYCPDAEKEGDGHEMQEIEEIIRLKWEDYQLSVKEPTAKDFTEENILENILKFRGNRSGIDCDTFTCNADADEYWRDSIWKFGYRHDYYTAKELIDTILNDYWFPEYNYKNFLSLFSNLLENWQQNWYSLFDLFFNNNVITKEKSLINALLDFYENIQHILLNSYPKLDEEKWIEKSIWKMHEILRRAISNEKPESIDNLKILLCKYILYDNEEIQRRNYYLNDLYWKVNDVYRNGESYLEYLKSIYKKNKWEENKWEQISRISEIFPNTLEWKPVSDTWFLYRNEWWVTIYWEIENYYLYKEIYQEWEKILSDKKHDILEILPSWTTLIDYWCYKWDKAKFLLDGIKKPIKYLPVDVDENMCKNAWENIASLSSENITILPWIKSTWDITQSIDYGDEQQNLTYMFTWWSIWNYQDETIEKILSKTFEPKDGYNLVLDYYKAPSSLEEIEKLLNCYDNPPTENWFISWLLNLWLQPRFFETALGKLYWTTENVLDNYQSFNSFNNLKIFIKEFLKFTVHYEFKVNNTKYFAELWENWKIIFNKYAWESIVQCDDEDLSYLNTIKEFPWKIIEWFKWIKNSENEYNVEIFHEQREKPNDEAFYHYDAEGNIVRIVADSKKSKQQVGFSINEWNKWVFIPANFKKWEFYPIEISRRFSDAEMIKFLKDAGRKVDENNIFSTCNGENWQKCNSKYLNVIVATT